MVRYQHEESPSTSHVNRVVTGECHGNASRISCAEAINSVRTLAVLVLSGAACWGRCRRLRLRPAGRSAFPATAWE